MQQTWRVRVPALLGALAFVSACCLLVRHTTNAALLPVNENFFFFFARHSRRSPSANRLKAAPRTTTVTSRSPVVLFPGDGGSQIWGKYNTQPSRWLCHRHGLFTIWVNPLNFLYGLADCMIKSMVLDYDTASKTTHNRQDINITVPGFGSTEYVEYLTPIRLFKLTSTSQFYNLVEHLVNELGYTRDVDIAGAPYDFRKRPYELAAYFKRVQRLIERLYEASGGKQPVTLIAHSMGNMVVLRFLQAMPQTWKDRYVRKWISTSPPFGGAVEAIRGILSGDNEKIFLLSNLHMRQMQASWPSTYMLMPKREGGAFPPDHVFVMTDARNYTMPEFADMLRDSRLEHAVDHYENTLQAINWSQPPHVPVDCVWSVGVKTNVAMDYRGKNFPKDTPREVMADGDGTVPAQSNALCYKWKTMQTQSVTKHVLTGREHLDILRHADYVRIVESLMR